MIKLLSLFFICSMLFISGKSQNIEDDYLQILKLDTKMERKILANELMLDQQEKYIIVNYGNKPTYIIVYDMVNFEAVANFRLSNWVDFSEAYVDYETNLLYIKESRYSSAFFRLNISTGEVDNIECHLTPAGCANEEPKISLKSIFTNDRKYYFTINKSNTREVKVYQLKK